MESKKDTYGLEPHDEPGPEPASIRALDVCPNCGSPLGGIEAVVCLRCGFDLKKLKVIKTQTGVETVAPEAREDGSPLSEPGLGDLWLPAAVAGASLLLLGIGYIVRSPALIADPQAGFGAGMAGLLKMLVRTTVLALAGLGGVFMLAQLKQQKLGDLRLAATRMLGVTAAIGLVSFFNADAKALEWTIETLAGAAAFLGLTMLLFRLNLRDAATLLGVTVIAALIVLAVSKMVTWSLSAG